MIMRFKLKTLDCVKYKRKMMIVRFKLKTSHIQMNLFKIKNLLNHFKKNSP